MNATFRADEPTWANACVGDNGAPDIIDYASGFATAANAMLDAVIADRGLDLMVDRLIYPICFNMRHAVELFLKASATALISLATLQKRPPPKFDLASSHDLGNLWAFVKAQTTGADVRLRPVVDELAPHVDDLAEIDSTGQVFRYPFDTDNRNRAHQRPGSQAAIRYR